MCPCPSVKINGANQWTLKTHCFNSAATRCKQYACYHDFKGIIQPKMKIPSLGSPYEAVYVMQSSKVSVFKSHSMLKRFWSHNTILCNELCKIRLS